MENRRTGERPIPSTPELFINEQQVHGLIVLKKFGWKLVCIRREEEQYPSVILKNRLENTVGILQTNGILRLHKNLQIRKQKTFEIVTFEEIANTPLCWIQRPSNEVSCSG